MDTPQPAPRASVVIPAFNAGPWIAEQLDSLAAQREAPDFEVLVCDNGSTDDTADVVASGDWPFPVRVVRADGRKGASHARNVGAEQARGDVLLFCDADDIVNDVWVRTLVDAVEASDGALVAGALLHERFNDPEVLAAYGIPADPSPEQVEAAPLVVEDPPAFAGFLPTAAGGNCALPRRTYLAVGGMDPDYPGGSEETDFAWRVQLAGTRVVSAPRATIQYRLKAAPRSLFRQQRIQQRARIFLWTRWSDRGMTGPSLKYSATELARLVPRLPRALRSRAAALETARLAGGHVGALEGMLKYRFLRRG